MAETQWGNCHKQLGSGLKKKLYLCSLTTHNNKHTTHNTQHTTHNTKHTTHNTQHTTHNTQHTTHKKTKPHNTQPNHTTKILNTQHTTKPQVISLKLTYLKVVHCLTHFFKIIIF